MDGVTLLVRNNFDVEYVLEEIPIDVFKDLILIVTKQQLTEVKMVGQTMMLAIGSLLSKDSASQVDKGYNDEISRLDKLLRGDGEVNSATGRQVEGASSQGPPKRDTSAMLESFHRDFQRTMGVKLPPLNKVITDAKRSQIKAGVMAANGE